MVQIKAAVLAQLGKAGAEDSPPLPCGVLKWNKLAKLGDAISRVFPRIDFGDPPPLKCVCIYMLKCFYIQA